MVLDAARAAHIPGVGAFGSGFLSDPSEAVGSELENAENLGRCQVVGKLEAAKVWHQGETIPISEEKWCGKTRSR